MALFANLITHPPLSQVSVVPPNRKEFNFTVVLESSRSFPERPWEVSIWYDHSSYSGQKTSWQALDLTYVDNQPYVLHGDTDSTLRRYTFAGNLPSPFTSTDKVYKGRRVPFTVRYRIDQYSEWQWVYHNFGILDGELILQPPIDPNFLGASPVDLKHGWWSRKLTSEAPGARLYAIESTEPIATPPPGSNEDAREERRVLGRVLSVCRWFALIRIWSPWLAPRHGEHQLRLSEPALFVSFLRSDGLHVVILAVNGVDDVVTTFSSSDDGEIVISARNDSGKDRKFRTLVASAWNFEVALASVMYEMRKQVRSSSAYLEAVEKLPKSIHAESVPSEPDTVLVSSDTANGASSPTSGPTPAWLESWYDALAYCTWNSLGQDLNLDKIMTALQSLSDNGIHIGSLIIDDNWQSLSGKQGDDQSSRGWRDFEANPDGFPKGLKASTALIREKHPSIRDIAVWHALMGYWGGIDPEGNIAKTYKTHGVKVARRHQEGATYTPRTAIDPSDIGRMYNDFYSFLSDSGVTGVKTDVQFMLDELTSTPDRRNFTSTYLTAWTQAHLTHLSGKAISCMSCIPQILYGSFLPTATPRIMLRNSDDFFPDIPESHPWHIFANAHNALFTQHLNILPDWDMFQTSHPYSGFHAAARCLSGGPIYITDTPGQHDVDLIHQMTALNPRGQTVILRPSNVGKTMGVYDRYEEKGVLKIGVFDGKADSGTPMLGVFNMADKEINFLIPITKFPGVRVHGQEDWIESNSHSQSASASRTQSRSASRAASRRGSGHESIDFDDLDLDDKEPRWIVRSHVSRRITRPITPTTPISSDALLQCKLPVRGYDVWSALPVREVSTPERQVELAVLGLLGKMTGAAAVIESKVETQGKRVRCFVQLKALGTLGIWVRDVEGEKGDWRKEDMMVLIQGRAVPQDKVTIIKNPAESVDDGVDNGVVIEVDVLASWKEMELSPGWSNEVGVEVFVS